MTEENKQELTLTEWWATANFDGKQMYSLTDNGELTMRSIGSLPERVVTTIELNNADIILNSLVEKFPEVEEKAKELQNEWEAEQDKLKLYGKVERLKEYLKHAAAVGNFQPIIDDIDAKEVVLAQLMDENYGLKTKVAEQAEQLADSEDWKETTDKFKELTDEWKSIGFIDKDRNDQLWNRIEAARDKFYERKREHHEDVEKEMLANLDLKMEVVEKAEKLAASEDWKAATQAFKDLMEEWKNIGRTMHDKNEELWNRFITAKNVFFDKKKEHYNEIQEEQEENLKKKLELVEKAEQMQDSTDWKKTSNSYKELMDEWRAIGRVPAEKSDELWDRLNAAKDKFYNAKREHFQAFKVSLEDNYAQKLALLKRAKDIKNSTRWRETTDEMNELMTEWKKIGPVPREHSDSIWEEFIGARKQFFNRKDDDRDRRKQTAEKRIYHRHQQTKNFLSKLTSELDEEKDKLADFKEGLSNIHPDEKKADELKEHLNKLIGQTEKKIQHKEEKLDEVTQQLKEIEERIAEKEAGEHKQEEPAAQPQAKAEETKEEVSADVNTSDNDTTEEQGEEEPKS